LEQRLEAHVDALIIGGELALETCVTRAAAEDDAGELYVAARLFARHGKWDAIRELAESTKLPPPKAVGALADALAQELPHGARAPFPPSRSDDHLLVCALLDVISRRRDDPHDLAIEAVHSTDPLVLIAGIRTVGRLREQRATAAVRHVLRTHPESSVRSDAALALAKMGDPQVVADCVAAAGEDHWPHLCLGLAGGRSAIAVLLHAMKYGRAVDHTLLSLGLLGEIGAIEPMLDHLGDHPLSAHAALALDLITGAGLMDDVPEHVYDDELLPHEEARLTPALGATEHEAETAGRAAMRVSTDLERWRAWWDANRSRFASGVRYRGGDPHGPNALVECLTSDASLRVLRELADAELMIRYGSSAAFGTELLVAEQERAIDAHARWAKAHGGRFHMGAWYNGGQLLRS
jgi:uncharacterized protein (TIGR02270 family)